jgi:zinc protease
LITEGTSTKSAPEIATEIESLGASIGGSAGYDFTAVYGNSPADVFDKTAALLAELARNPVFAEEEVNRAKAQTLDGLLVQQSEPGSVASLVASRVIYGVAPYGYSPTGTAKSVPSLSREDLVTFHRTHWRPSTATLVFSGDIEPDAAFALAERLFGDWKDAPDAVDPAVHPAGEPTAPRVVVIDQPNAGQAAVLTVNRAIARTDPDFYALLVGNAVLGGGYSARLNKRIRVERGLSYGASSSLSTRLDQGVMVASSQTRNDAAGEVSDLMLTEIARLSAELVSAEELAPRRATLVGSFSRSLETVDGLGGLVANLAQYALPLSELKDYADKVRAVTPEQIRDAVSRKLPAAATSLVIVGDAKLFFDAVRAKHPNVERIALTALDLDKPALK